jgi:ECF sigma factor
MSATERTVEMKVFGGLSAPEISPVMGLSRAPVDRDWDHSASTLDSNLLVLNAG